MGLDAAMESAAEKMEQQEESLFGRVEEDTFNYVIDDKVNQSPIALTAIQDREVCTGRRDFPSHGHCVWDAALVLADYIQYNVRRQGLDVHGKRVVELGAGVGLVGMAMAAMGAEVILTDQEYALPLLRKNVAANFECEVSLRNLAAPKVAECQWGEPLRDSLVTWGTNTDILVFSDVLYNRDAVPLLLSTVQSFVGPDTLVLFSFETRDASIEQAFLDGLKQQGMDVEMVQRKEHRGVFARFDYPDELFIYRATLRKQNK